MIHVQTNNRPGVGKQGGWAEVDHGKTPRGIEGALGHEAKHDEAIGKEVHDVLAGTNANTKGLKDAIDDLDKKEYGCEEAARKALPAVQKAIEEKPKKAPSVAATHDPKGAKPGAEFPRWDTAERSMIPMIRS